MEVTITKDIALRALLHGACDAPRVGAPVSSLPTSHLIWAEDRKIVSEEEIKKAGIKLPLWVLSGNGYGYGYGNGNGDGDGDGNGYGYGNGNGDGDGDGNGNGDGDGYGLTKKILELT